MAFILYLFYSKLPWQLHHFYESRHHGQLRHAVAADFDLCVSRFHHYLAVQHDDTPLTWIGFHNAIVTNRCLDAPINWWYNNPVSQLQPPFQKMVVGCKGRWRRQSNLLGRRVGASS